MKSKPNMALACAMRRSVSFLRAAPENDGARALHFAKALDAIQRATEHLVLAGHDALALKLVSLRADADAAFGASVHAMERDHLEAETLACNRRLASPRKRVRR